MWKKALIVAAGLVASPASAAAVLNPHNGHWYEYVSGPVDFATALTAASSAAPKPGYQSHLVTVTSALEQSFIFNYVTTSLSWIAASDSAQEGNWIWVAGPESGQALSYADWSAGEPNDYFSSEDAAHMNWGSAGTWNDINAGNTYGYIVEYSSISSAVPEPATWAMMLLGFGAVGASLRRKTRVKVTYATA